MVISESSLFACLMACMLITCILSVLFGQIIVCKLRKNPKTKDALRLEFAGGWDIINLAQALAFPRSWSTRLPKSRLSFMYANAKILLENTSKLDRFLGVLFSG
jgi:hypothetical protein